MGDVIPNLADLILPIIEEIVKVDWGDPVQYDRGSLKIGRYRGSYVLTVYDDWVRVRTTFEHLRAADPDFIDKLKKALADAKIDIDTFEHGTHGKVPR